MRNGEPTESAPLFSEEEREGVRFQPEAGQRFGTTYSVTKDMNSCSPAVSSGFMRTDSSTELSISYTLNEVLKRV